MTATPNHALQRTAPCVTAPASAAAFPPTMHLPRRTPRSLSLGSFGASLSLSMSARFLLVVFALLVLCSTNVFAQKLEKVSGLKLEYWRAFDDLIQQEIRITHSGEIVLNTTITPIRQPGQPPPEPKHTVKTITERDLASVLAFFNYAYAREFFATHKPRNQVDGAALSITVTQGSFSMSFISQDAFTPKASQYHLALGRLAVELFNLAGLTIPKNNLY